MGELIKKSILEEIEEVVRENIYRVHFLKFKQLIKISLDSNQSNPLNLSKNRYIPPDYPLPRISS